LAPSFNIRLAMALFIIIPILPQKDTNTA